MRSLRAPVGRIPRAFKDHRRKATKVYREYCLAVQARWGPLPDMALPWLREGGRAAVELEALSVELEQAKVRKRRRDISRLRRQQFAVREQVGRIESRIQQLAESDGHGRDVASQFAAMHQLREAGK
jgi:hypothetical protein